jgi:hypothetical protein
VLAETTRPVKRAKNQIRDTSAIRSPRGRPSWRIDTTNWAIRAMHWTNRLVGRLER